MDGKGVKLPKYEVPTFDGNLLNWRSFWEQFCVSVHDCPTLSDPEKFVYLQQALKNGSAKNAIEGLSRSGEHDAEAVECLKSRYDRDYTKCAERACRVVPLGGKDQAFGPGHTLLRGSQ